MASLGQAVKRRGIELARPYLVPLRIRLQQTVTAATLSALNDVITMLRVQGDADDELAEVLGRTLARLSAEVEALSAAVARLEQTSLGLRESQPADR